MKSDIAVIVIAALVLSAVMARFGRRSGVSRADMLRTLPGDSIIAEVGYLADRATVIAAPAEAVWPWLVQLGKGRGGWYAPAWLEHFIPKNRRAARKIVAKYQQLAVGDIVDDWGLGSFKVVGLNQPKSLVYVSLRQPKQESNYLFSWAHLIEPIDHKSCRLYTRLRLCRPKSKLTRLTLLFLPAGGFFDYLTIKVMYAGLKERVAKPRPEEVIS